MHTLWLFLLLACPTKDEPGETGSSTTPTSDDADNDGLSQAEGDCDDADPEVNPYATDLAGDGVDQNCDGIDGIDADADGYASTASGGDDCDDASPEVNPGATEECNDLDDDCDGTVDANAGGDTFYADGDDDGYGDADASMTACDTPAGYVENADDCDDDDASVWPGAEERCDGVDNDCDGEFDEDSDDLETFYADADADGYGDDAAPAEACELPSGYATQGGDCDDGDAAVHPAAAETCNGVDDDCDGWTDDADPDASGESTWYDDSDGDGYGDPNDAQIGCDAPADHVPDASDCDDSDADVNPAAAEVCNGKDDDCDGMVDDDDPGVTGTTSWHVDGDGDGYGAAAASASACDEVSGMVADGSDCDDADATIHPGAQEVCDPLDTDEDCDGLSDDDDADASGLTTWYVDTDGDGYGSTALSLASCDQPSGFVDNTSDCNDATGDVYPGAEEIWYDGDDGDCDGLSDYDADYDGYTSADYGGDDCDDADDAINVAASEIWYDGVDQDCAGDSDYDADADTWDSTTYGGEDCDDTDDDVYPGASESDDAKDNDCDGDVEAMPTAQADYDTDTSTLLHCDPLYLDGSASSDPEGTALTYDWSLSAAPATSVRVTDDILETTDESPVFYPDVAGTYAFSLLVADEGDAWSGASEISVSVGSRPTNSSPVVVAGDDQVSSETTSCTNAAYVWTCDDCSDVTFTLDGSATEDGDGDFLTYAWSITSGESYAELADADSETASVTVWGLGATYGVTDSVTVELELSVTDCYGETSTDTVNVTLECTGS